MKYYLVLVLSATYLSGCNPDASGFQPGQHVVISSTGQEVEVTIERVDPSLNHICLIRYLPNLLEHRSIDCRELSWK